jgi:hypothetical protein
MIAVTVAAATMTLLPVNVLALSLVPSGRNRNRIRPSATGTSNPSSAFPLSRILMESTIERTSASTNKTNDSSAGSSNNLSPFLRNMVNEQRELQMNVGKAMDVLTNDYPYFLRRAPGKCYHLVVR